jgi:hypothetical protein
MRIYVHILYENLEPSYVGRLVNFKIILNRAEELFEPITIPALPRGMGRGRLCSGIMGSNPTRGIDVYPRVSVLYCVG